MKNKKPVRFLMYLLSTFIIFYSGAWSFWLEFNVDDPFILLAWIPVFALGVLLNIHFAKFNNKKEECLEK
tara:strand:+ start:548 stop:757 length:210 start_codon:yes stop_codon:yes gene_type:complete